MSELVHRMNYNIKNEFVTLIDEDGKNLGKYKTKDAILYAKDKGLDLIQVSSDENMPICKCMSFGKLKYEESKKKKSHVEVTKEIRLGYNISDHDFNIKLKHVKEFLSKNYKVVYVLKLKGCPRDRTAEAFEKFLKFLEPLNDCATWVPPKPSFDGSMKNISTILVPKK